MLRTTTEPHLDVQFMIHIHLSPPPPLTQFAYLKLTDIVT